MTAADDQRRPRRTDPHRRERIIAATLDLIAREGVAGVSHRKVAAAADVPLGSMTYHFDGMEQLLREAFTVFAVSVSDQIEQRMSAAIDRESAVEAIVANIDQDIFSDQRALVLTHELYTLAARDAGYRALTTDWMSRSRAALERHFDPVTARLLDALVEGLTIHRALDLDPELRVSTRDAVARIVGE